LVAVEVVGLDGTRGSVNNIDLNWSVDDFLRVSSPNDVSPSTLILTNEDGKVLTGSQTLAEVIDINSTVYIKRHPKLLFPTSPSATAHTNVSLGQLMDDISSDSMVDQEALDIVREIIRRPLWKEVDEAPSAVPQAEVRPPSKRAVRSNIEKIRKRLSGPKLLTHTVSVRKLLKRTPTVVFGTDGPAEHAHKKARFTYVRPYGDIERLDF
jgi:hypothetical protein